jgi:hypothetical protein
VSAVAVVAAMLLDGLDRWWWHPKGDRASGGDLGTRVTISLLPVRTGHRQIDLPMDPVGSL